MFVLSRFGGKKGIGMYNMNVLYDLIKIILKFLFFFFFIINI